MKRLLTLTALLLAPLSADAFPNYVIVGTGQTKCYDEDSTSETGPAVLRPGCTTTELRTELQGQR